MRFITYILSAIFILSASVDASAKTLVRGNGVEPQTLDIHQAQGISEQQILRDIYEGLLAEAADGSLIPGVAESWTVNSTKTIYTFKLRRNAKWSNGDPVVAGDFVFAFQRLVDPTTSAPFVATAFPIKNARAIASGKLDKSKLGIRALGPHGLEIKLEKPTPYFLQQLVLLTAYPLHQKSMQALGAKWLTPGKLVSNGPYVLKQWQVQAQIHVTKNGAYHGADKIGIKDVYFIPVQDDTTEFRQYRAGQMDITSTIPPNSLAWAKKNLGNEVLITPLSAVAFYLFNLDNPKLQDTRIRQALSMAIDRKIITDKVDRVEQIPAKSFVPSVLSGYSPAVMEWEVWPMEQRLKKAKSLLAEAGYSAANPLEIEILYRTDENIKRRSVAIAAMWKALGVKVRLRNEEWKVYLDSRRQRTFEVSVGGWVGEYSDPFAFLQIMHSKAGPWMNYSNYQNDEYDALLDQANAQIDDKARLVLLKQAEAVLLDDQPLIPLYFLTGRYLIKPYVTGFVPNPMNVHPSRWMNVGMK